MYIEAKSSICNFVMTFLVNGLFDSIFFYKTHIGKKKKINTGRSSIYKMYRFIYHLTVSGRSYNIFNLKTYDIIFITATSF